MCANGFFGSAPRERNLRTHNPAGPHRPFGTVRDLRVRPFLRTVLTTVVFFTGGATISAMGEARKSTDKQGEESLRVRELSWRKIIDNIPGFVATMGPMGEVEFLNHQILEYFGKTEEELKDWSRIGVLHPDDLPRAIETWRKSIETGQAYEIDHRCRRADGVFRWFNLRGLPVRNAEGTVTAWIVLMTDIDDRRRAEDRLRQSEEDLRTMTDTIRQPIGVMAPDGTLLYVNRAALDESGLTLDEAIKEFLARLCHPDEINRVGHERRIRLLEGVPFDLEMRLLHKSGQYRWYLMQYNPLKDESGQVIRWYATATDIDDRKRAEDRLRQSEEDLRTITDAIRQPISVLAPDGTWLYANRVALNNSGLTLDEVIKEDFFPRVVPPDDINRVRDEHRIGLLEGIPFDLESRLRFKSGQYRWQLIQYNPLKDESGQIIRWYVTLTDIDDRKRAEEQVEQAYLRLAEAQRLSKTGSFIADLLVDEHDWSEEAFRIFEFDPTAKVNVQMVRDTIHPEDLPTFDDVIARGTTGTDVDFGFRIVTPRGAVKHLRGMARVMAQSGGRPKFIGAFQDVTESKIAEEAVNKARSELADVARVTTLNALTASIAHEINQPLASLVTNASICLRRLNADPPNVDGARERMQRAISDANRASDVITRLHALFSKKELTLEPLDLNEATREIIVLTSDDLQRKRVLLLTDFEAGLPAVKGDRVQLQQVILNLMRNASDAMSTIDDRPRELLVRTEREEVDRVRLSVKDAGVGLEPQGAERLFQPFYTTKSGGMGIGLSISRSIIEAHHGRLWAAPNAGPGATFSFSIPRMEAHSAKPTFAVGFLSNGDELMWMPEVVKILREEFPNVDVTTSSQYSPLLAEALSNGQIDAALLRREEGRPDLAYETLLSLPFVVYLAKGHRLAAFQEIDPQDLVGETFIIAANTGPVLRRTVEDYLNRSGVKITATHEVDHPGRALSLVSSGGVMIVPTYLQNFLPDSVTKRPLKGDPPTIDLVLGYKKSNQSPILKFLISRLDELIACVTKRKVSKPADLH